jgi:hypothetical protein
VLGLAYPVFLLMKPTFKIMENTYQNKQNSYRNRFVASVEVSDGCKIAVCHPATAAFGRHPVHLPVFLYVWVTSHGPVTAPCLHQTLPLLFFIAARSLST